MNWNNYNSNWKKLLGFRNMQEKLEKKISLLIFIYHLIFLAECMVCFKQRFTLDTWPYSQWAWDLCAPRWAIWAHPYLWGKFTRQSKLTEKTVKIDWKKQSKLTEKTVKIDWKQNKKSAGTLFWWHSVVFF